MGESFDDMMRRELGEDFGLSPDMEVELGDLLERYALPHEGVLHVFETVMDLLKPLARLRTFADRCEAEQVVPAGFRREIEALIIRQLTRLSQTDQ
jgi:hypothetical protein